MHKKLNKKVALKIYEKERIKDIQRKKSVRREIRLMKRLSHAHIAILYEAIETEDQEDVINVLRPLRGIENSKYQPMIRELNYGQRVISPHYPDLKT